MYVTCLLIISTFLAFALASTRNATFETFTVLLLAHGVLAVAPLEVLIFFLVDFTFKRLDVSFQDFFNCSPPLFNMLVVIEAVPMHVALALWTAHSVVS